MTRQAFVTVGADVQTARSNICRSELAEKFIFIVFVWSCTSGMAEVYTEDVAFAMINSVWIKESCK